MNLDPIGFGEQDAPPKTYRYDLTDKFRNQFLYILKEAFGYSDGPLQTQVQIGDRQDVATMAIYKIYAQICQEFCKSIGVLNLPGIKPPITPLKAYWSYFLSADTQQALKLIGIAIRAIPSANQDVYFALHVFPTISLDEAVEKLNLRFRENAIGYRMESGEIVRIDSEFLHVETTEPAFALMHAKGYKGAIQEFQLALKYHQQGPTHYDDCLTNCLKAVESTLQKIIESHNWEMPGKAKFDNLFTEVKKKGLFPPFLSGHLGELEKFLQAVAVIRNEEGGHGSGSLPNEIPDHLVAYQIHLTGSAIVFLIRCSEDYEKRTS